MRGLDLPAPWRRGRPRGGGIAGAQAPRPVHDLPEKKRSPLSQAEGAEAGEELVTTRAEYEAAIQASIRRDRAKRPIGEQSQEQMQPEGHRNAEGEHIRWDRQDDREGMGENCQEEPY